MQCALDRYLLVSFDIQVDEANLREPAGHEPVELIEGNLWELQRQPLALLDARTSRRRPHGTLQEAHVAQPVDAREPRSSLAVTEHRVNGVNNAGACQGSGEARE